MREKHRDYNYLDSDGQSLSVINGIGFIEGEPNKKNVRISIFNTYNFEVLEQLENNEKLSKEVSSPEKTNDEKIIDFLHSENIERITKNIEDHLKIQIEQKNIEDNIKTQELKDKTLERFHYKEFNFNEEEINSFFDLKIQKILSLSPSPERDRFLEHIEQKRQKALDDLKKGLPKTKTDYINLIYELRRKKIQDSNLPSSDIKRQLIKTEIQRLKALRSLQQAQENNTTSA